MNLERESYVALLDILGFKELVSNNDLKILALALKQIRAADHYPEVRSLQFSDSILLYTEGTTPKHLRQIVGHATLLVMESLERRIGLRGGVTRGKFLHDGEVFLGPAMVRAYELEQMQDWIGGIVDPELTDAPTVQVLKELEKQGFLVRYEAPIKGGSVGELWCLAWPIVEDEAPRVATRAGPGRSWDVMRKLANTSRFHEFCLKDERQ